MDIKHMKYFVEVVKQGGDKRFKILILRNQLSVKQLRILKQRWLSLYLTGVKV